MIHMQFARFYFMSNIGAAMGDFGAPTLRASLGFRVVMISLLGGIALAQTGFTCGTRTYRAIPTKKRTWRPHSFAEAWNSFCATCYELRFVLKFFAPLPVFWALFYTMYSVWVFQSEDMDRVVGKLTIPEDAIFAFQDICAVLAILFADYALYPIWTRLAGNAPKLLHRVTLGLGFATAAYLASGLVELGIARSREGSVSVFWQVPQLFLIACGEILVAIAGLELCFSQSPPHLRNLITALWTVVQAIGAFLSGALFSIPGFEKNRERGLFTLAGLMFVFIGVFLLTTRDFVYKSTEAAGAGAGAGAPSSGQIDDAEREAMPLLRQ